VAAPLLFSGAAAASGPGWVSTPGDLTLASTLNGMDETLTSPLALDVADGVLTTGWNITLTSTAFSTGGGTHTLSSSATTVQSKPADTCDSICTPATNLVAYPYSVPAGSTPPAATKLFNAAALTGVGNQTITPTFSVAVPAKTYAGTYTSTWTLTLASGP
jgi:hypothetical protein